MGMFDEIRVEMILPDQTEVVDTWFQTKSFDNMMDKYTITENGELYRETWKYMWVDDDNHFLKGYLEKIPESYSREYLTDLHGDIIFYSSKPMKENRIWRDYTARFTEGKLTKLWYEDKQY
jgi:hypothetical protein